MRKLTSQFFIKISLIILVYVGYFLFISPYIKEYISEFLIDISRRTERDVVYSLQEYNNSYYVAGTSTFSQIGIDEYETGNDGANLMFADPRIIAMRKFLSDYNSPMYPYADIFVIEADKTGLDWRLVASISGVESGFGNVIPLNTNNAWGWKGGPGGNWSVFPTWREGIETVTNGLAYGYGTNLTPFQIEPTYCPPCGQEEAHPWANGVTKYMNDLSYYLNNLENL